MEDLSMRKEALFFLNKLFYIVWRICVCNYKQLIVVFIWIWNIFFQQMMSVLHSNHTLLINIVVLGAGDHATISFYKTERRGRDFMENTAFAN